LDLEELHFSTIEYGSKNHRDEIALRYEILRKPLGLQFTEEQLAAEKDEVHWGAFLIDKLVGCLLLKDMGDSVTQMRAVAVSQKYQGCGIGAALVRRAEQDAWERGYRKIVLDGRETALQFYKKLGYVQEGDVYIRVGLPHWKMSKELVGFFEKSD